MRFIHSHLRLLKAKMVIVDHGFWIALENMSLVENIFASYQTAMEGFCMLLMEELLMIGGVITAITDIAFVTLPATSLNDLKTHD